MRTNKCVNHLHKLRTSMMVFQLRFIFVLNKCKVNSSFQYLTSRIIIIYDMNFVKGVQIT